MPKDQSAEVVIRGKLKAFMRLAARREEPATLFIQGHLCLDGDAALGIDVKNLMDRVDPGSLPRWVQQGIKIADHFQH